MTTGLCPESWSTPLFSEALHGVYGDRESQNCAPRDELRIGTDVHQVEAVVDHHEDKGPDQSPPDRTHAAEDAGPAQYRGGDGVKFDSIPHVRLA